MTFTKFKDRVWTVYGAYGALSARLPRPLGRNLLRIVDLVLWVGWCLPRSPLRRTMRALAAEARAAGVDAGAPLAVYRRFVGGVSLGLYRMERLRAGHGDEIDALLRVPEAARLDALLAQGGLMVVMPHAHGSLPMIRALAQRHPVTLLARATRNDARARAQRIYYDRMGATVIDVRRTPETRVARHVLRALRAGEIVIGAGDLIGAAPEGEIDRAHDRVRVTAFEQPVGAAGWPQRFAARAGVPILPIMVSSDRREVVLHLGAPVPHDDPVGAAQAWMDGLLALVRAHPADWTFVFDRHWMRVLAETGRDSEAPRRGPETPAPV